MDIRKLGAALGWFSVILGAAEILFPSAVGEAAGIGRRPRLMRFYGLRELMAGLGILGGGSLAFWLAGRVAGDALDLATIAVGRKHGRRARLAAAAVAGVTALDAYGARRSTT